jgi:hypothetical protein
VDDDTRSTEEYLKDTKPMDISSVPAFQRPMDASENDQPTGNIDETGAIEYRTALGNTYLVRRNPDQRTTRTKIEQDVLPTVKDWLQNPKAPTQDQILDIGKGIAESVYDLVSIPGDLATGKKSASDITLGNVYDTTGMMAVGSAAFGVPEGALRTFGGSGMELDSGELSNFKKARELMKAEISNIDPSQYDQFYWANKKVWNATGWYINPSDKQWRFEIDDKKSKIDWNNANISDVTGSELKENFETLPITKPDNDNGTFSSLGKKARTLKLSDFFTHDNLYKRYPFLKDLDTEFYNEKDNTLGSFTPGTNLIKINVGAMKSLDQSDPRFRSTLLHEIQHAIQYHEGFSHGANSAYIPSEVTKDLVEKSEAIKSEAKNNIRKNAVDLSVKHGFNNLYDYFPLPSDLDKLGKKTYYDLIDDNETMLLEESGIQPGSELYTLITNTADQYRKYVDGDDITKNMEFKFYLGADGEIESRLVQATLEDSAYQGTYPIDRANKMLNERDPDRYDEFVNTPEFRGKVGEGDKRVRTPDIGEADVFITPEKSFVDFLPEVDPNKPGYNMEFTTKDEIKAKTEFIRQLFKGQPKLKKLFNIKPRQKFTLNYEDGPLEVEFAHYSFRYIDKKNLRGEGSIIIGSDYDKVQIPTAVVKYPEGNFKQMSIMELINSSNLVKDFDIQDLRNTQKSSPGFLSGIRNKLGFAEGGEVAMNQQMSFAFEDGGLRDDGMMRDPVSGNEVPPGSTAKEVRDDIPAQLSEGEYVVPADVVRYYGVKFFEDLRDNAKMGLQDMEARGRIGGEPVPIGGPSNGDDLSPEEIAAINEMMGMAEGGVVNMYKQQQDLYSAPNPAIGNPTAAMNQGGTVAGYQPGGSVATDQDFLQAGQQAQQRSFAGFPLGATIFPSAQTGQTVLGPEGTQVATTDAIGGATAGTTTTDDSALVTVTLYGPNGEIRTLTLPTDQATYDQLIAQGWSTEMPVAGATGGGDDDREEVETDPNAWMNKFNYNDFGQLADQTSETLTRIPFGGVIGALGNGTKAAQAAANIIIMKANGYDTKELEKELKKFRKETGVGILGNLVDGDMLAKDIVKNNIDLALTRDATDLQGDPIFKDDNDFNDFMQEVAPTGMTYNPTLKTTVTTDDGGTTVVTGGYSRDDDSPSAGEILGGTKVGTTSSGVNVYSPGSSTIRPVLRPSSGGGNNNSSNNTSTSTSSSTTTKSEPSSFSQAFKEARAEQGSGGTFSYGGKSYTTNYAEEVNEGGLMMSSKPKKKTRKYNKGGLAGKK